MPILGKMVYGKQYIKNITQILFYPNIYHNITIVSYVKYGSMGNIIW